MKIHFRCAATLRCVNFIWNLNLNFVLSIMKLTQKEKYIFNNLSFAQHQPFCRQKLFLRYGEAFNFIFIDILKIEQRFCGQHRII